MRLREFNFEYLSEAQNYEAMFRDLLRIYPKSASQIETAIKWARKYLKKQDRIIWYLRWVKVVLLARSPQVQTPQGPRGGPEAAQQLLAKLNQKLGTNVTMQDVTMMRTMEVNLAHFLSLPIPGIQNTIFGNQSPIDLFTKFNQLEQQWKELQKSLIDMDEEIESGDVEKVIAFPDGFTWWDLKRPECRIEAKAMGHCGNSAAYQSGETILSLRKPVPTGPKTMWYPVLTFILDSEGFLGEMKGRGNDKPAERYHEYIIPLLKLHIIRGIKGGGYAPERNFGIDDLDHQTRKELVKHNANLRTVEEMYREEGMSENVQKRLRMGLDRFNIRPRQMDRDDEGKRFIIREWDDLLRFSDNIGDEALENLVKFLEGDTTHKHKHRATDQSMMELILDLPEPYWRQLMRRGGVTKVVSRWHAAQEALRGLKKNNDPWLNHLRLAIEGDTATRDAVVNRIIEYCELGFYFPGNVYTDLREMTPQKVFHFLDNPIYLYMDYSDAMDYASYDNEEALSETLYDLWQIQQEGWDRINWENQNERRKEEGLIGDNVDAFIDGGNYTVQAFINLIQGRPEPSMTTKDKRQLDLSLEGRLIRLDQAIQDGFNRV